jgi:hypothetical protein
MDALNKLPSLSLSRYQMGQFSVLPGSLAAPPAHKDPIAQQVTDKLNFIPTLRRFPTCTHNHSLTPLVNFRPSCLAMFMQFLGLHVFQDADQLQQPCLPRYQGDPTPINRTGGFNRSVQRSILELELTLFRGHLIFCF